MYSTEGDELTDARDYSDKSLTEEKQKFETQRKGSTSKKDYNSNSGVINSSPEIIFVLNNTDKLRLVEDAEILATEKPDRYRSMIKTTVQADQTYQSSQVEPSLNQSINAIKRPPRPQERQLVRAMESIVSTEDLEISSNLQAKYVLLKYLLSDTRIKVLSVRQAFEKLKQNCKL